MELESKNKKNILWLLLFLLILFHTYCYLFFSAVWWTDLALPRGDEP